MVGCDLPNLSPIGEDHQGETGATRGDGGSGSGSGRCGRRVIMRAFKSLIVRRIADIIIRRDLPVIYCILMALTYLLLRVMGGGVIRLTIRISIRRLADRVMMRTRGVQGKLPCETRKRRWSKRHLLASDELARKGGQSASSLQRSLQHWSGGRSACSRRRPL